MTNIEINSSETSRAGEAVPINSFMAGEQEGNVDEYNRLKENVVPELGKDTVIATNIAENNSIETSSVDIIGGEEIALRREQLINRVENSECAKSSVANAYVNRLNKAKEFAKKAVAGFLIATTLAITASGFSGCGNKISSGDDTTQSTEVEATQSTEVGEDQLEEDESGGGDPEEPVDLDRHSESGININAERNAVHSFDVIGENGETVSVSFKMVEKNNVLDSRELFDSFTKEVAPVGVTPNYGEKTGRYAVSCSRADLDKIANMSPNEKLEYAIEQTGESLGNINNALVWYGFAAGLGGDLKEYGASDALCEAFNNKTLDEYAQTGGADEVSVIAEKIFEKMLTLDNIGVKASELPNQIYASQYGQVLDGIFHLKSQRMCSSKGKTYFGYEFINTETGKNIFDDNSTTGFKANLLKYFGYVGEDATEEEIAQFGDGAYSLTCGQINIYLTGTGSEDSGGEYEFSAAGSESETTGFEDTGSEREDTGSEREDTGSENEGEGKADTPIPQSELDNPGHGIFEPVTDISQDSHGAQDIGASESGPQGSVQGDTPEQSGSDIPQEQGPSEAPATGGGQQGGGSETQTQYTPAQDFSGQVGASTDVFGGNDNPDNPGGGNAQPTYAPTPGNTTPTTPGNNDGTFNPDDWDNF